MLSSAGRALRVVAVGRNLAFSLPLIRVSSTTSRAETASPSLPKFDYSSAVAPMPGAGRDELLAAAYEVNFGGSPEQLPPSEAETAAALPTFDYSSAAPMRSETFPGSIIGKVRVEQGLPEDGPNTEYSPADAMTSFIAQQGGGGQSAAAGLASARPDSSSSSRNELLAAAYKQNSPEQQPTSEAETAAALPKFDYSSAAPMRPGAGPASIIRKVRVEQGLPEDGPGTAYSPDAAMASFIAQQGGVGQSPPTAAPAAAQAAPAPRAASGAPAAAPGVGDTVSEGVASLRMVDALEAGGLLSDAQACGLRWLAFSHPPLVSALRVAYGHDRELLARRCREMLLHAPRPDSQ